MQLVAIAGEPVATKTVATHEEMVQATKEIFWHIPEVDRVNVNGSFGSFTIHRDSFCLCETESYPCECGLAGQ